MYGRCIISTYLSEIFVRTLSLHTQKKGFVQGSSYKCMVLNRTICCFCSLNGSSLSRGFHNYRTLSCSFGAKLHCDVSDVSQLTEEDWRTYMVTWDDEDPTSAFRCCVGHVIHMQMVPEKLYVASLEPCSIH